MANKSLKAFAALTWTVQTGACFAHYMRRLGLPLSSALGFNGKFMLIPHKVTISIFFYIVFSVVAISLVSFAVEKFEPYLIEKLVTESSPGSTQQEVINHLLAMEGKEVRNKLETLLTAITITKLSINAFILYLCSCFIVKRFSSNLLKLDAANSKR